MKSPITRAAILLFAATVAAPGAAAQPSAGRGRSAAKISVTVSAAASLQDALEAVQRIYQRQHAEIALEFNFGGSGSLRIQIEQGAPVDVFLSASTVHMDALAAKGLLRDDTRVNILKNRVVLIVPRGEKKISSFADLTRNSVRLVAMGEPVSVPAGAYAKQVLTHLGIYDQVRRKAVLAKDVRQVLAYVETGNVDAGIVYATDARITDRVEIVAEAPPDSHAPVVYPAAVLRNARHPEAALDFVRFLRSPAALAIFEKYGFSPAGP